MPRSLVWCALEPVKWCRAVAQSSGGMARRSTCMPLARTTLHLVSPLPSTCLTPGNATNRSITATGSRVATSTSRSATVSRQRRAEPPSSSRSTAGLPRRNARISWPTTSASTKRCLFRREAACEMPSKIFCSVFSPKPLTARTRPASHAAFSSATVEMPRASCNAFAFLGPKLGSFTSSTIPAGSSLRSLSSAAQLPVR